MRSFFWVLNCSLGQYLYRCWARDSTHHHPLSTTGVSRSSCGDYHSLTPDKHSGLASQSAVPTHRLLSDWQSVWILVVRFVYIWLYPIPYYCLYTRFLMAFGLRLDIWYVRSARYMTWLTAVVGFSAGVFCFGFCWALLVVWQDSGWFSLI